MSYAVDRKRERRRNQICQSFTCISPWFLFRRWLSRGRSVGEIRGKQRKMNGDLDRILEGSRYSEDAAGIDREASFNIGVGFGLIYLAAASRNELNKMAELHREMELLLRNLQSEFGNQEKSKSSKSSSANSGLSREDTDSGLPMDHLEAEVETEFNSLQVRMDEEHHHPKHDYCSEVQIIQFDLSPYQITKELKPQQIRVEESFPGQWWYGCSGINEYYAVPPRELERKLHELLEAQQQERIVQLETSLDRAMLELEQRRREVGWWKDTARLIARRVPPVPYVARPVKKGAEFGDREMSRAMVMSSLHEQDDEDAISQSGR